MPVLLYVWHAPGFCRPLGCLPACAVLSAQLCVEACQAVLGKLCQPGDAGVTEERPVYYRPTPCQWGMQHCWLLFCVGLAVAASHDVMQCCTVQHSHWLPIQLVSSTLSPAKSVNDNAATSHDSYTCLPNHQALLHSMMQN